MYSFLNLHQFLSSGSLFQAVICTAANDTIYCADLTTPLYASCCSLLLWTASSCITDYLTLTAVVAAPPSDSHWPSLDTLMNIKPTAMCGLLKFLVTAECLAWITRLILSDMFFFYPLRSSTLYKECFFEIKSLFNKSTGYAWFYRSWCFVLFFSVSLVNSWWQKCANYVPIKATKLKTK